MDYRNKTAQECMEEFELYGRTVVINDGKVSSGDRPAALKGRHIGNYVRRWLSWARK